MAKYAKDNHVKIYVVTFGEDANEVNSKATWDVMEALATETDGKHFHADDGYEVISYYEQIAGLLQDTAGGETNVALDFGLVNINQNLFDNVTEYMDYKYYRGNPSGYQPSDSTYTNRTKVVDVGTFTVM